MGPPSNGLASNGLASSGLTSNDLVVGRYACVDGSVNEMSSNAPPTVSTGNSQA